MYTKGEWDKQGNKITKFGQGIVAVCPSPNNGGVLEFVANAQLIAAAPEFHKELSNLVHQFRVVSEMAGLSVNKIDIELEGANKALAKAESKEGLKMRAIRNNGNYVGRYWVPDNPAPMKLLPQSNPNFQEEVPTTKGYGKW